jgi:uncharacterized protein YdaT
MPWTGKSFAKKHNHSLGRIHADKASQIANAVYKSSGDEAKAIRIANATIRRMNSGGKKRG